jgi:hypothetical protein
MNKENTIPLVMLDPLSVKRLELLKVLQDNNIEYWECDRTLAKGHSVTQKIEILVSSSTYENARLILKQVNDQIQSGMPSFCPDCDGEVITDQIERVFFGLFKQRVFRCEGCGHKWQRI